MLKHELFYMSIDVQRFTTRTSFSIFSFSSLEVTLYSVLCVTFLTWGYVKLLN